jgi:hypothetical protein
VASKSHQPVNKITEADFSKEDKMNVLLFVLGNDEIVSTIYSLLFRKDADIRQSLFISQPYQIEKERLRFNISRK